MNWIDTHAHPYMCTRPLNDIVDNAHRAGVTRLVSVATTLDNAKWCREAAGQFPGVVFPTIGIHPTEGETSDWEARMKDELSTGRYVAVGEIGLDYHWSDQPRANQIRKLEIQLSLAETFKLPVIIHNRKSEDDMIPILATVPHIRKVIHCFSLAPEWLEKLMGPNTYFSFTGMITRWDEGPLLNSLKAVPHDKIMLETDCPYLTPQTLKGNENQPAYLVETAKVMAAHRNMSLHQLAIETTNTAELFFGLPNV